MFEQYNKLKKIAPQIQEYEILIKQQGASLYLKRSNLPLNALKIRCGNIHFI